MNKPILIEPRLQHYDWGDRTSIAQLLRLAGAGTTDIAGVPIAEAWFGAHPKAPSQAIVEGQRRDLNEWLAERPLELLGETTHSSYSGFPFLAKLLAADRPLSIQAHPSKTQAASGFARQAALPISTRSYQDQNHKPELLVALAPFYALCSFRPAKQIAERLDATPELKAALPQIIDRPRSLKALVTAYYNLPADLRVRGLRAWMSRVAARDDLTENDPEYWALDAHRTFSPEGGADAGLFFFLLLHFVRLAPGQGLYLQAGVLHAYLRGFGVEVMASSDNVLRGGLTPKPIDIPELLSITRFEYQTPWILNGERSFDQATRWTEVAYPTSAEEFEVAVLEAGEVPSSESISQGPEILIVLKADGPLRLTASGENELVLSAGKSCLVPNGIAYRLAAVQGSRIARVRLPRQRELQFRGKVRPALRFGTSGLRGKVSEITDLEAYINARGFVEFLLQRGLIESSSVVYLGGDRRPSTDSPGRSILKAVHRAVEDAGLQSAYLGKLPTPALMYFAVKRGAASIMVTGSHIPFDRNGIKFNKPDGEVLKADEPMILEHVQGVRRLQYAMPQELSLFDDDGMFKPGKSFDLPAVDASGEEFYRQRYLKFFPEGALVGLSVGVYQHSAVGRDFLVKLLADLGAKVHPFGASEEFVAIDTEAFSREQQTRLERQVDELRSRVGALHAVVSTDGDSDRPLILGADEHGGLKFFSGDRVGMVVAEQLGADTLVVPVSSTDGIEQHFVPHGAEVVRTKIGSPHVIAKLRELPGKRRVGWEANGGFLVGSDLVVGDKTLSALPTRDAMLPIIAVLRAAKAHQQAKAHQEAQSGGPDPARYADNNRRIDLASAFAALPARFSSAALLDNIDPQHAQTVLDRYTPRLQSQPPVVDVDFRQSDLNATDEDGAILRLGTQQQQQLATIRDELQGFFTDLGEIVRLNFLDGIRVGLANGDFVHLRPSGNAPQFRIYAIASTQERAEEIVSDGVKKDGLVSRLLERAKEELTTDKILGNVRLAASLAKNRQAAALVGCVSGSETARAFWQRHLELAHARLGAKAFVSLHEDRPVNQALGVLLAWQRLRELATHAGTLIAFVFGEGSRATPFTETDNGQKPAILSFVSSASDNEEPRYLPMVELAMREFATVEAFLRRSGFDGIVIKWGDEVQIASRDLSQSDPLFHDADVVRFVAVQEITAHNAVSKDWVGVDEAGAVTAFIPRRPLEEMQALAEQGLLQRRGSALFGGINLGSIALSRALLESLLEEFSDDLQQENVGRGERPDLDPQFFTALVIARQQDEAARTRAWKRAQAESKAIADLERKMPNLLSRLRRALDSFEAKQGRKLKIVALDLGDIYWGDIGQHQELADFYLSLTANDTRGRVARALAGLATPRDEHGNIIVRSRLPKNANVRNAVIVDCDIRQHCDVEGSVLLGTQCDSVTARSAFDVWSICPTLRLEERAGTYRVVDEGVVHAAREERLTTLFLSHDERLLLRVQEKVDLRDRQSNYETPILGNRLSFAEAHNRALETDPNDLEQWRTSARARVREKLG